MAQGWSAQILQYATGRRLRLLAVIGIILVILSTTRFHDDLAIIAPNFHEAQEIISNAQPQLSSGVPHLISPKIWQIVLPKDDKHETNGNKLQDAASWLALNKDYTYTLVGQNAARKFVLEHFASEPAIVEAYDNLANVGMKSDLLRYLILDVEGGVYTDTDTIALKPINDWVPKDLQDQVRLIVGIEFDRRDGGAWADIPHWLQFCQWTIAAAPRHPVFRKMVRRILESLEYLSDKYEVPVKELHPDSFDVMNSTGPAAWTDVVFEHLQEYDPSLNTTKDLSFMTGPKLYGDILVLNIDGFGMGQPHSHSTNDGSIPELALAKHLFRGSWRGD